MEWRISVSGTALILSGMVSALIAACLKGFLATWTHGRGNRSSSAGKMFARALRASETGREWDRNQRENNREEFLEKRKASRAALVVRSPERLRKEHAEWREKRYEAKKLYCETCKATFATPSAMENHNATPTYLNKAEEMKRRYTCIPCAYGANRKDTFNTHLMTKRHSKMVADLSSFDELD